MGLMLYRSGLDRLNIPKSTSPKQSTIWDCMLERSMRGDFQRY
jgi:hypothetical protein